MEKKERGPTHQVTLILPLETYNRLRDLATQEERALAPYLVRQLKLLANGGKEAKDHEPS